MILRSKYNSEKEVLAAICHGDKRAFKILYNQHAPGLFQYGNKICEKPELIKDVVQELFLDLWNQRKTLKKVKHIKSYLIKSFRNKLIRALKKSRKFVFKEIEDYKVDSTESKIIISEIEFQNSFLLRRLILNLPERQKEIIHLRFFEGLSLEQLADVLSIRKQSVSNLIHRALQSLKKDFSKKISA